MALDFALRLEDRRPDRVVVSVLIGPGKDGPSDVDGVVVVLVSRSGETLSHRLVLPIAGSIHQAMVSTVELRSLDGLPPGSRVAGWAWRGSEQWEATCPADPGTQLEAHVRGRVRLKPRAEELRGDAFEQLACDERDNLRAAFPWLTPCAPVPPPPPTVLESAETEAMAETAVDEGESLRDYCRDLGLCDEDTDWLQSLLDEDES